MTGHRWKPYGLLAAACAGLVLASIFSSQLLGHRVFESLELHAASLAVGALAAIIVALLLLGQDSADARDDAPVAIGLLGMGILDGFHALAAPGQAFVCLQGFAALAGALGFLLGWLPPAARRPAVFWTRWLPAAFAAGAVALGLVVALRPAYFPSMIQGRTYTAAAIRVQLTAGALFVVAALRFLIDYRRSDRADVFLFGCMGMLFGVAALMVPFSTLWDGAWWTWHAVRFGAYLVALWLSHQRYISVIASLRVAEALGESRTLLDVEHKRAEEAARFLSETSQVLASSIDFSTTLARVAELAVPQLADWCVILLAEEDGYLRPVKVACTDPGRVDIVRQLERPIPPPSTASSARAVRSGQPELTRDIKDEHLVAAAIDPEQLAAMRRIGIRSRIAVPLRTEGRPLGAIVFLTAESRRRYDDQDLLLAREVGRRAAQAVANARLYQTAQRAIHTREEVLAVVSHDLRNPLGAISLSAKVIAQISPPGDGGDRVREKAQQIQQSVQRMDHLIRDLLDAAAIEAGRFPISRARCEAQSLVGDALELMRPMARERGLRLEWRAAGALPDLDCDRDRVLQVFSNLIGNAIKFTPEHGSITVSAEVGAGEVRFAVADTGPGIPEDALPHLFDRYWQASHARRAGVGLGLYIVKGIAEAHGGKAWVESRPGGSTFFFTLPTAGQPGTHDSAS